MRKRELLGGMLLFAVASSFAAAGVPAPASALTADQLIRKNVEARGGESNWQRVSTMTVDGKMDVGQGMQVPYTMDMKRGRKVRVEIVFQGKTAVQVYDGQNGWKRRPFLGHNDVEAFTPDEQRKASLDSDIDGLLIGYVSKGTHAELEGKEQVEGHGTYKLKLTLKDGQVRHVWIDDHTYLESKLDGTRRMNGKEKTVETYFRDYRTIDGLKIPFVYETSVDGVKASGKIEVETVQINTTLADSLFAELR
jgi:hypothetical protein